MSTPEISIVMAVNRIDSFLDTAIESILNQTFKNYEFIIVINGIDKEKILEKLKKFKLMDKRIKIYSTNLRQLQYNLNFGIDKAKADIIARMDSDDISLENRIEEQYKYFKEKKLDILGTDFDYIDDKNNILVKKTFSIFGNENIRNRLTYHCVFCHPTLMYKKEVILNVGGYCFGSIAEDWDLFLRLSRNKNIKFDILNKKLLKYRKHKLQMSVQNLKVHFLTVSFLYLRECLFQKKIKYLKGFFLYLILMTPIYRILKILRK